MEKKIASVEPITDQTNWSSKAVFGSALADCPDNAPSAIAAWIDNDGVIHWRGNCCNAYIVHICMSLVKQVV